MVDGGGGEKGGVTMFLCFGLGFVGIFVNEVREGLEPEGYLTIGMTKTQDILLSTIINTRNTC